MTEQVTADQRVCSLHNVPCDVETECAVCGGDGELEDDEGGVSGCIVCWSCQGSGLGMDECEFCLDEERDI